MTKRFKDIEVSADTGEVRLYITDNDYTEYTSEKLLNLLNKQDPRIQELEDKLENWKQLATVAQSENSILHNELGIAIEQGYALSDAFKEYQKKEWQMMTERFTSCINEDMDYLCLEQAQVIIQLIKRCETLRKQKNFFKEELEKTHRLIKEEHTFNWDSGKYKVTKEGTDD